MNPYGQILIQDSRVVDANESAARLCALTTDQLISNHPDGFLKLVQLKDRERVVQLLQRAGKTEHLSPVERVWITPLGAAPVCVDLLAVAARHADGPAVALILIEPGAPGVNAVPGQPDDLHYQRETGVMRDVIAAMAGAGDVKSTLETLMVHLHDLIHYDRAGLFLVDEDPRSIENGWLSGRLDGTGTGFEPAATMFHESDPLVMALRRTQRPLVVSDPAADPRLTNWPELHRMHSWLGAPLLAGDEMLGFLSLGSLETEAYGPADVETMTMFAQQVAVVLEQARLREQSQRRTEELEVLSSITSTLGQAERGEGTLLSMLVQLAEFFGAGCGALLTPDRSGKAFPSADVLVVKTCTDQTLEGMQWLVLNDLTADSELTSRADLPTGTDPLWRALQENRIIVLSDVAELMRDRDAPIYGALFSSAKSAVAIPMQVDATPFGLLLFTFEGGIEAGRRKFSSQDLRLFETVAELTAASLRRVVVLEALEEQVHIRTQHLSTLYRINTLASEPLDLPALLEDILYVAVAAMDAKGGAIHFLNGNVLELAAQNGLPPEALQELDALPVDNPFLKTLLASNNPAVIPALEQELNVPEALRRAAGKAPAYLGAAIRAKNGSAWPLGIFSLYAGSIESYSVEDITLFMTIADQIGGLIERARLVKQAELAAVVQERQRLARELHDSVTQLLYSQVLFSGAGLKVLRKGDAVLAEGHLQRIEQGARQALKEMRLLLYELRPSDTLDEGLIGALERRLEAVEKRTGINVQLHNEGCEPLEPDIEMALYRIAEEALNNTLKHAQAGSVSVIFCTAAGQAQLTIEDDGVGFNPNFDPLHGSQRGGMGLTNIHERAAALGGSAQVISQPGKGTRVVVDVPISARPLTNRRNHEQTNPDTDRR